MTLHTRLCDRLGIEHPILQSGMGRVAGPELVAAVSRAGGLGILGGLGRTPDELRADIRRVRELTDRPFGVNLWLHPALLPPIDTRAVPEPTLRAVQGTLDRFREPLGLPANGAPPRAMPDLVDAAFETILDQRVPVFSVGLGDPGADRVRRCHERGIKVIAMVATVEDARTIAASGVDAIVAQGSEAGGHRSSWVEGRPGAACIGTLALVPQVVDAVAVPVIAAGGIADGRGMVAALALGASGILLGTRFVASHEATVPPAWQRAIRERSSDETIVTDVFTGLPARAFRNQFTDEYGDGAVLPPLLQASAAQDIFLKAGATDDARFLPMFTGQAHGLVRDLPGAAEIVARMVEEAHAALAALPRQR